MKNLFDKILSFTNGNTGIVIAQVLCFGVLIWIYGCDSKVPSVINPAQRINRAELDAEVQAFLAIADIRFADLNKQDAFRETLFEHMALWAQGGTINPVGLALALSSLCGIGATYDNVTKRRREKAAQLRYTDKVADNNKNVIDGQK